MNANETIASAPSTKGGTHTLAIDPGPFKGLQTTGDVVILIFERGAWAIPRCTAIGLAYFLSELVE